MQEKVVEASWYRMPVPRGYVIADLTLRGVTPLLMNSGEVDLESAEYRAFVHLTKQRNKSLEQESQLRRMEWALCMYWDEDLGPFIPGKNIHEMVRQAATKWRRGADVSRSVVVADYRIPLQYDGPRDQDGLWEAGFRYTTLVANGGMNRGRVPRTRPKFVDWKVTTQLAFDPEDMDLDTLQLCVERSQKYGLGDYRTGPFGRFTATLDRATEVLPNVRVDAETPTNGYEKDAHRKVVESTTSVLEK